MSSISNVISSCASMTAYRKSSSVSSFSVCVLLSMISRYFSTVSLFSSCERSSRYPDIDVSGVRRSCDMFVTASLSSLSPFSYLILRARSPRSCLLSRAASFLTLPSTDDTVMTALVSPPRILSSDEAISPMDLRIKTIFIKRKIITIISTMHIIKDTIDSSLALIHIK